jgi:hypothetical protein
MSKPAEDKQRVWYVYECLSHDLEKGWEKQAGLPNVNSVEPMSSEQIAAAALRYELLRPDDLEQQEQEAVAAVQAKAGRKARVRNVSYIAVRNAPDGANVRPILFAVTLGGRGFFVSSTPLPWLWKKELIGTRGI